MAMTKKWIRRYLQLSELVAGWSKDVSTQVGAVLVRPDKTVASLGYNGFPRTIEDTPALLSDREAKYERMVHAEMNAILNAREGLEGYSIFTTIPPCARCTVMLLQAGIREFVTMAPPPDIDVRWSVSFQLSQKLIAEAGGTIEIF